MKQQNDKISVIVPVYKAEPYLNHCIQSIVGQTYQNLEIILVDDGSPDRCPEICDAWAEKDTRIRVIHQANAGGGPARNAGLDCATGDIIAFVDSDDYLHPKMYEYLYDMMNDEIDVAECEILTTDSDDAPLGILADDIVQVYPVEEAMRLHIYDTMFRQTPPNKLYRRHTTGNVRFPAGTRIDDEFFTYRLLGNAKKLAHGSSPMYAYRQQGDSLMHSMGSKRRMEAIEAKQQRHAYLQNHFPNLVGESLKNLWFTCIYQAQLALREQKAAEAEESVQYIEQVLKNHPMGKVVGGIKEKIWLSLAKLSLPMTCKLRNGLKIGL